MTRRTVHAEDAEHIDNEKGRYRRGGVQAYLMRIKLAPPAMTSAARANRKRRILAFMGTPPLSDRSPELRYSTRPNKIRSAGENPKDRVSPFYIAQT